MLHATISKLALVAAGGAVAALAAVGPAAAAQSLPEGGGQVHKGWTKTWVWVHENPSHHSDKIGKIPPHRTVYIKCKVQNHGDTWYKLAKHHGWVDADKVKTHDWIPRCRYTGGNSNMSDEESAPVAELAGEPLG
ncbi:hypothetical protein N566_25430 [Streptomycetaceae bacterium MP113-05]|nr:hypothetical protein N566_25430 [Streptomycetaceae bacterium MP113-05]